MTFRRPIRAVGVVVLVASSAAAPHAQVAARRAASAAALLTYPGLQNARNLESSREEQRQDWIVYTAVFTFIAAVDAYVTAHLQDFPAEVSTSRSSDGGVSIGVRVPWNFGR